MGNKLLSLEEKDAKSNFLFNFSPLEKKRGKPLNYNLYFCVQIALVNNFEVSITFTSCQSASRFSELGLSLLSFM